MLPIYTFLLFSPITPRPSIEYHIITTKPVLLPIRTNQLNINFYYKRQWQQDDIVDDMSSPELTALDLVHYADSLGGLNKITEVLDLLTEIMDAETLAATAKNYADTTKNNKILSRVAAPAQRKAGKNGFRQHLESGPQYRDQ